MALAEGPQTLCSQSWGQHWVQLEVRWSDSAGPLKDCGWSRREEGGGKDGGRKKEEEGDEEEEVMEWRRWRKEEGEDERKLGGKEKGEKGGGEREVRVEEEGGEQGEGEAEWEENEEGGEWLGEGRGVEGGGKLVEVGGAGSAHPCSQVMGHGVLGPPALAQLKDSQAKGL